MLDILKKELNISIITSIVYIILGIVIISNPELTISIVGKTIAILSILCGIILTIINLTNIHEESSLIFGIFTLVMGIALLIYPNSLSILISLGLGIWFISSSVTRLKLAIVIKNAPEINWSIILMSSIITLMIGISFIFAPLASAVALTTVSGIMMVIYSIIDLFEIFFIKQHIDAIENALK